MINDWLAIAQEEGGKKEGGDRERGQKEKERGENSAAASDWSCR